MCVFTAVYVLVKFYVDFVHLRWDMNLIWWNDILLCKSTMTKEWIFWVNMWYKNFHKSEKANRSSERQEINKAKCSD